MAPFEWGNRFGILPPAWKKSVGGFGVQPWIQALWRRGVIVVGRSYGIRDHYPGVSSGGRQNKERLYGSLEMFALRLHRGSDRTSGAVPFLWQRVHVCGRDLLHAGVWRA